MDPQSSLDEPAKITNGEKLVKMMQDDDIKKRIQEKIDKNGYLPILILEIRSNDDTEYELDEEDIKEVFSRFGLVEKVKLLENSQVLIYFQNATNAGLAQEALNNHHIDEIILIVNWWLPKEISNEEKTIQTKINENNENVISKKKEVRKKDENNNQNESEELDEKNDDVKKNEKDDERLDKNAENVKNYDEADEYSKIVVIKYTARYDILIENERKFQVCRRIIGPKGTNMKQIIDLSCQTSFLPSYSSMNDIVKLRLRGKGSGFKEGNLLQESSESLHLCVSSKYHQIYLRACYLVEKLLLSVYEDYRIFCLKNMVPLSRPLGILKKEFINGGGHPPTLVPSDFSFFGNSNNISYFEEERINAEKKKWEKGNIGNNSFFQDEHSEKMKNWAKPPNNSSGGFNASNYGSNFNEKIKIQKNLPQPNSPFVFESPIHVPFSEENYKDNKFHETLHRDENSKSSPKSLNEGQYIKSKQVSNTPTHGCTNNLDRSPNLMVSDPYAKDLSGTSVTYDPYEMSNKDAIPYMAYPNSMYFGQNNCYDGNEEFSFLHSFQNVELNEENIRKLIEARNKARKELKFHEADYIRAFLKNRGIALIDEKGARGRGVEVTTWKYSKYWKGGNSLVEC